MVLDCKFRKQVPDQSQEVTEERGEEQVSTQTLENVEGWLCHGIP